MRHKIQRKWSWMTNRWVWILQCPERNYSSVQWALTHPELINKGCPRCGN